MHLEVSGDGRKTALYAGLFFGAFFVLLLFFFEPRWETNDDVGMSMVAHGYGIVAKGSPNLIFSNVVWGYIVRAIPGTDSVVGYSIATMLVLFVVGAMSLAWVLYAGNGILLALTITVLIFARPILVPQFTINAGLLLTTAFFCFYLHQKHKSMSVLALGVVLASMSWWVRSQEFLLVLALAAPFARWRNMFTNKSIVSICAIFAIIVVSTLLDKLAYDGQDWLAFHDLNLVRAAFTDFGIGEVIKKRPDVLSSANYSVNDIDLISRFFFVDGNIASPSALQQMISNVGGLRSTLDGGNLLQALKVLYSPALLPLFLGTVFALCLRPSWKIVLSWGIFLASICLMGLLGRPAIVRVYIPLLSFLVLAPFIDKPLNGWRSGVAGLGFGVLAFLNFTQVTELSRGLSQSDRVARESLSNFPQAVTVGWGAAFPFEAMSPVLHVSPQMRSLKLYSLGVFTLAPFSVAYDETEHGRSLIAELLRGGISLVAFPRDMRLLEKYCEEHYAGKLLTDAPQAGQNALVSHVRCAPAKL